jgi:hypothetical protein
MKIRIDPMWAEGFFWGWWIGATVVALLWVVYMIA